MGWLGRTIVLTSSTTGIWEPLLVGTVFAVVWTAVRTASPELGMVLGYGFDLAIPMEYQSEPTYK